jgi:hypothetical protein
LLRSEHLIEEISSLLEGGLGSVREIEGAKMVIGIYDEDEEF